MTGDAEMKKRRAKRALKIALNTMLAALYLLTAVFVVVTINGRGNGGSLLFGDLHIYNIVSGSMGDAVPVGSTVLVRPVDVDELQVGDVISFRSTSMIITHRICDIYTQGSGEKVITTKGDSNETPDADVVFPGQIVGRVALCVPVMGYVFTFLTSKLCLYLLIIPLFLVFAYELLSLLREINAVLRRKKA